ncbi:two-component system, sporulation sensor kinase A [Evansella caseinilytica]|uniref:histidine kinase n=1 Tax=Evansella caseinilytica TaxID=1503961 RepID=A0A1H3ULU5_9BACI|nr:ATP-binding protein [Evansella caseinilytica]SDZ63400.1 two-component system, sporulation sensor kinase A [Evansella caseinilytica]
MNLKKTEVTENELDFKQIVDHSLNAKIITDGTNVIYINQACLNMLQVGKQAFIQNGFLHYFHPACQEKCNQRIQRVLAGRQAELAEQKIVRTDGEVLDVEVMCAPFYNNGHTLVQIVVREITERKKNERLLLQSEKLSLIGEVAAGIVHEIRNPLTTIKGFVQILQNKNAENGKYLDIMKSEVERIEKIANDLLELSKPQAEIFKQENVVDIFKDVLFMWETEIFKHHITVNYHISDDDIPIFCERTQITQTFINLIKNAIEACADDGEITAEISKNDQEAIIKIDDNGAGIPKAFLEKLGTAFQTSKANGTGLGLAVTYNIIKNHNGKIIVESEEGSGTTFIIRLPLYQQGAEKSS